MIDPALGINSIIQEQALETAQPNRNDQTAEYIYDKEFWGDEELTYYLLDGCIRGRRDASELPQYLDGTNFIAQQAGNCAIRSLVNSIDNPNSQVEEGVAITINPFDYSRNTPDPFNFHQVTGNQSHVSIPMSFGNERTERTIATVHCHPLHPARIPGMDLTAPSPQDLYMFAQDDYQSQLVSAITNANDLYILIPTKKTPVYKSTEILKAVGTANDQIDRRYIAEFNYAQRNFDTSDPKTTSLDRLIYLERVWQRVVKAGSINLADRLGINVYHRSLLSESEDKRFKRLV